MKSRYQASAAALPSAAAVATDWALRADFSEAVIYPSRREEDPASEASFCWSPIVPTIMFVLGLDTHFFSSHPMAKPIVFQFGDRDISFEMHKVDRSKLYGFKEIQALDESSEICQLATLAGDGCTLIGKGGTGFGWLDADGSWCDKSALVPVDKDGREVEPVQSSFSAPLKLFDTATVEEYLEHNIRLVYAVEALSEADDLMAELNRGTIFTFPYSYRGGLEADAGFLLANESGEVMMAVGTPTQVEFIGMSAPAATVDETGDQEEDVDMMDFDMI